MQHLRPESKITEISWTQMGECCWKKERHCVTFARLALFYASENKEYKINVNWYFLMEPSRKSHAIEMSLFLWRDARWRHWNCGYTQLYAATINHLHVPVTALMFGCSGTQIYDPEVRDEGSGQPWDNDRASWSSVLHLTQTRASRAKGKSLIARPVFSLLCYLSHSVTMNWA